MFYYENNYVMKSKTRIFTFVIALVMCNSELSATCMCDTIPFPLTINLPPDTQGGNPRMPTTPIYVNQVGNSLFFDIQFVGYSIELWDEEGIVYLDEIDEEGKIELPSNLLGTHTLRLYVGDAVYQGEITL